MTLKITTTDFIQKTMRLDGQPWRFTNRPYIYPILNNSNKRILMLAARQVEKSTSMAACMLAQGCLNPNRSYLYVSPTMKQTGVFSRKKIDEVFETSPILKKGFYPGVKGFRVEEKRLKTCNSKYGGTCPCSSKEILEKSKKTCIKKFGKEYWSQTEQGKQCRSENILKQIFNQQKAKIKIIVNV